MINIAVVTISDSCSIDPTKDLSGPALAEAVKEIFPKAHIHKKILPDEQNVISNELIHFCDDVNVDLILTTGGSGMSKRDVTPEATRSVIHKEAPAIPMAITIGSLKSTPMAMISRAVAGIRNDTLIINFPGSKKAVIECFNIIKPVLQHTLSLLRNDIDNVNSTHKTIQGAEHSCTHNKASNIDTSQVAFRPRESPYPLIEMCEAYRLVDELMQQWTVNVNMINIEDSLGHVIAEEVRAREPLPPFPASIKDGYACLSGDGAGVRRVVTAVIAGDAPGAPLVSGMCARINTGAALPPGADCVVQVEDTILISASGDGHTEYEVEILVAPTLNKDVRPIGADIQYGSLLADKGAVLDAALIGVLAGAGIQKVLVNVAPKVALMSTGNELQEPSESVLKVAHIRDSNRLMLKSLLREHGYDSIDCGIARDEPAALMAAISSALAKADVLVCTGGVSMGERDLLKPVLMQDFDATLHFGRVRMKPGKPSTFATCQYNGRLKYIFALPGNPVSAYVCCHLFVLRALRLSVGCSPGWASIRVVLAHDVSLDPRPEFARASLRRGDSDLLEATLIGKQDSSRLLSACGARVLLELPSAVTQESLAAGTIVTALVTSRLDFV